MYPTEVQAAAMEDVHCAHARFVWNLCVEQQSWWTPYRGSPPDHAERNRQLTEARAEFDWLADGSQTVQQQALRDYNLALDNFFNGSHGLPGFRRRGESEGFQIVGKNAKAEQLNGRWSRLWVPKVGWVKFRPTRPVPDFKSYRVTKDRSGRWHVAFAVTLEPIDGPGTGAIIGVDRGVVITAALSEDRELHCPTLTTRERARLRKAERRAARAPKGSDARRAEYGKIARLRAVEADRRKDFVGKTSTDLVRNYDLIRFEKLNIVTMTASAAGTVEEPGRNVAQKAGLNRAILAQGWGSLRRRTEEKAPGRVQDVPAPFTSLRCSRCGWIEKKSRESQAVFCCVHRGFTCNADLNAAKNVAAGQAVARRPGRAARAGGTTTRRRPRSVREPQPLTS
jgi:transposase